MILLISDRPDKSQKLARRLQDISVCQAIRLDELAELPAQPGAIVTDVAFDCPATIERLRDLIGKSRGSKSPVVAVLREDTHQERVQATAIGATRVFNSKTPFSAWCGALAPASPLQVRQPFTAKALTPEQNIEHARLVFENMFGSAARGELFSRAKVDDVTDTVVTAISEGGIRRWLEIVWAYHDRTYQHCLLVTGLAAEFAKTLAFSANDQKQLTRGALLHDIGKANVPVEILDKPGTLTSDETAIMRTHARAGYELLCAQGEYEPELLDVVLHHHEMLDGSGYPDGLAGAQICDLVRLVTICDIYAALIEQRPYRPAVEPTKAFKMLAEMEGKLEEALVNAFTHVALSADVAPQANAR